MMKLEGFSDLDRALGQLPKATARNVLKRTLTKAAAPIEATADRLAPVRSGALQRNVITSDKLTKRQKRDRYRSSNYSYELYVGTALSRGLWNEYGTFKMDPQPFMTPAWELRKQEALDIIKTELGNEVEKAATRLAKKRARAAQ